MKPRESVQLAQERDEMRERQQARIARAEAARRRALEHPATQAAITAYRIERERAAKQGKPVLRPVDEWRGAIL